MFVAMTLYDAEEQLRSKLAIIYDAREAANIADWVVEQLSGLQKIDRLINKTSVLSEQKETALQRYTHELLAHKPVQYVLNEAWFSGMKFYVDENVLIPRPETEELVEWINGIARQSKTVIRKILDIGTGSGCIPIVLKKKLPETKIYSCDISDAVLAVAHRNAALHQASVEFMKTDFLDPLQRSALPDVDCIVSNPPYIPAHDMHLIARNVTAYEPHLALFVPAEDPLVFYKAMADFGIKRFSPGGKLFAELHESYAAEVERLFAAYGFSFIEIKKDMQGKERMIKATWLP
jgi:release factor glutamine methyltransferase